LVFTLPSLSNVIDRRGKLMACSKLQDLVIVQRFFTAGVATQKYHSISTADSSLEMERRQRETVSKNSDRNLLIFGAAWMST
jgi:hypothetical protein